MIKKYKIPRGTGNIKKQIDISGTGKEQYRKLWDMMHDPNDGALFFMTNCCWVKKNGVVQFVPRDYQREMIFNYNHFSSIISLFSRQNGKTTTTACYILWYAMCFPAKDILITSYGEASAMEIMETIKFIYEYCPNFLKIPKVADNKSSIVFSNDSRIFCRPTTTKAGRGLSPAIVYCDEFAFVGTGESAAKVLEKQKEFYSAILPTLSASHGKLFITSTPQSQTDMFYTIWSGAINKLDDNHLNFPSLWILKYNNEEYMDWHLFNTKDEAEQYILTLPPEEQPKYEVMEKEPIGNNGFMSQLATWEKDPEKTPEWAQQQIKSLGDTYFQREFCCLNGKNSIVSVMDEKGHKFNIAIEDLYKYHMN